MVMLIASRMTVKLNSKASRETPSRSGPHVAMMATEEQLSTVPKAMKTAAEVTIHFRDFA